MSKNDETPSCDFTTVKANFQSKDFFSKCE